MTPLGTQILLRPLKAEEQKSAAGIIVKQEGAREQTSQGVVVTTSLDVAAENNVRKGDKVLYPTGAGTKVTEDGDELLLVDVSKLLAILSRETEPSNIAQIP
jgi:co-chaperonin GroES (HSP10)